MVGCEVKVELGVVESTSTCKVQKEQQRTQCKVDLGSESVRMTGSSPSSEAWLNLRILMLTDM